jgi:glucose-1-phosphate thymidylyltransferase
MKHLKVVIPMAGVGKRMGPLTRRRPKPLVRLTDRRLIDHVLHTFEELEETGSLEYIFIVGYLGEQIRSYMKEAHPHKHVTYVVQDKPMGQSHAVHLAGDAVSGPVLLTYCDTINRLNFSFLSSDNIDGIASVHDVDDPRRHGVAVVAQDRLITRLIEKPKTVEPRSALTGLYYFSEGQELLRAIEIQMQRGMSLNNEYYLADAVNILLEQGKRVRAENVLQWLDAGTPEAIIQANASLLQEQFVSAGMSTAMPSTTLLPPVHIHESSCVEDSVIGPNVSIGRNCSIRRSTIENTIIDDNAVVDGRMLSNSFVDQDCVVSSDAGQSTVTEHGGIKIFCSADGTNEMDRGHAA